MAKKRKAYVHVGMPGVGDVVEAALVHHRRALVELGIAVPAKSSQEAFRAAVEVMRTHKEWGFRRSEVEGQWAKLCRRVQSGRAAVAFSQPLLSSATSEQVALLLDGLAGFEVHVVVTTSAPHAWTTPGDPETDLGVVLDRWRAAVRKPERLHVVLVDADAEDPEAAARNAWKAVGKVVGFGTASLGLDSLARPVLPRPLTLVPSVPAERAGVLGAVATSWADRLRAGGYCVHGDVEAVLAVPPVVAEPTGRPGRLDGVLHDALREVERLRRCNENLEARLEEIERSSRKLRKRVEVVA
ncbi:MAG TPA: hypothetical protein VD859_04455 [Nocardioides sp.]|nr:hypothetical protein [Nocardioides sp.]